MRKSHNRLGQFKLDIAGSVKDAIINYDERVVGIIDKEASCGWGFKVQSRRSHKAKTFDFREHSNY